MDHGEENIKDDSQVSELRKKTLKILFQAGILALFLTMLAFFMPS
jgi:hypothetical protein